MDGGGPRFVADAAMPSVMLEGFTVLFHERSGATHLLASPAAEILAAIAPDMGPADAAGIVARLCARYDMAGDADAVVAARLAELVEAGLVRAA